MCRQDSYAIPATITGAGRPGTWCIATTTNYSGGNSISRGLGRRARGLAENEKSTFALGGDVAGRTGQAHDAQGSLRLQSWRRLSHRQLHAVGSALEEVGGGVAAYEAGGYRSHRRRPASVDGHYHLA